MTAMENTSSVTEYSLTERLQLLKQHPLFAEWQDDVLQAFAMLMSIVNFQANQVIVSEGDIVDSLYFIITGRAEVSRRDILELSKSLVLATLESGETIGLSATGLYSETGARTATVTAVSQVRLLQIKIDVLHDFLKAHPELDINLETATQHVLKMQLIKQAAPYAKLPVAQINWLAKKIELQEFAANTELFKQGDQGDYCYLIQDGQVEISRQDVKNQTEVLAVLSTPTVFGEAAILMNIPRTATAKTVTACRLLRLKREDLLSLVIKEEIADKAFSNIMMERIHPKRNPQIIEYQRMTPDNELIITLKNPQNHEYYQLNLEGWYIWQQLNGKHTLKEIILAFKKEYNIFSPNLVMNLIADLARGSFVEAPGVHGGVEKKLPFWMRGIEKIRRVMEIEWKLPNSDQWITKKFEHGVKYIFTWPAQILFLLIILTGATAFALFSPHAIALLPSAKHILLLIILVDMAGLISVPLHELAHAFTTKYFGREVHHFGFGWYWFGPMAYTDTSDMWLSGKWPRILVNLAGIFCDAVLAGISAYCAYFISVPFIAAFFWMFSLFIYLSIFHNLYPLIELDGYYTLMDLFDRPHLREDAVNWLTGSKVFSREYWPEIAYWLISLIFLGLMPLLTWFVQHTVLIHLFPKLKIGYWRYVLPVLVTVLALISLWVDIQKQRRIE